MYIVSGVYLLFELPNFFLNIYVDGTHRSQPLDLSIGKILFRSRILLPTSVSEHP